MDIVKRERRLKYKNGDRVSISSNYFGEDCGLYYGTVTYVSSSHILVTWDVDGGKSKHEPDAEDLTPLTVAYPMQPGGTWCMGPGAWDLVGGTWWVGPDVT